MYLISCRNKGHLNILSSMKRVIFEYLAYAVIMVASILISVLPDIQRIRQTPPGTTFPLIHNHHNDYFSYLSYMHSGLEGDWLTTVRISSAHYQPQPIYTFFVALGHLSRISGISLPWMYFAARIVFGILLQLSCLLLLQRIFSRARDRLSGLFLLAFSSGFWTFTAVDQSWQIDQYLSFWTRFDPIMRTTFLPHHTAATMLIILSILAVHKAIHAHRVVYAILAGFLGFSGGILYHGAVTNVVGAFGIFFAIIVIGYTVNKLWGRSIFAPPLFTIRIFLHHIGPFTLYGSMSMLSLLYVYYLSQTTWPWTISNNLANEFTFWLPFFDYLMMLGPTTLLTIIGSKKLFSATSFLPFLLAGWALFPFIGIYFITPHYPRYGNMIFMEAAHYIPLAILAVYGLQQIRSWAGKYGSKASLAALIILALYFIPAQADSVQKEINTYSTGLYNFYIPDPVTEGFVWLDSHTPKGSTVLSGGLFGAIIPAFTHNYVVFGDDMETYQMQKEHEDMLLFFSQSDPVKGRALLEKYKVQYVFYALDTDPPKQEYIGPLGLSEVFAKDRVVIYKVQ